MKMFDLEFSVDPLFKKMCAEFDESGYGGLLTNKLSLDHQASIILDSSDHMLDLHRVERGDVVENENGDMIDSAFAGLFEGISLNNRPLCPLFDNGPLDASLDGLLEKIDIFSTDFVSSPENLFSSDLPENPFEDSSCVNNDFSGIQIHTCLPVYIHLLCTMYAYVCSASIAYVYIRFSL